MSEQEDLSLPPSKRQKLSDNDTNDDTAEQFDEKRDFEVYKENEDKYTNFVTPEEIEKLREFKVLDEVKSNDDDSNDEDSSSSDGNSEGIPEEEIEKMLDEDLPEGFKEAPKPKEKAYVTRQKIVLEEKGVNHFEVLPLDWIMVRHLSGMPIYMHRPSRVCTLSKPYFLGKGNTRRHDIPISAIPCLSYRRALEEEAKQKAIDEKIEEQIRNGTWANNDKSINQSKASTENNSASETNCDNKDITSLIKLNVNNDTSNISCSLGEFKQSNNDNSEIGDDATSDTKNISIDIKTCPFTGQSLNDASVQNIQENNNTSEPNNESCDANDAKEVIKLENGYANDEFTQSDNPSECPQHENQASSESNVKQDKTAEEIPLSRQPVVLPGGIIMPPPRVETINTSWKAQHLTPELVNGYCKNLFKFKTVNIMHFKRWADRRKYTKARKTLQYPTLPEGTKLITIPAQTSNGRENGGKTAKRDWVMNMNGRSYLSVFHEYVHRALQKQPVYEFKQLENAASPYQATVFIGGMQYGVGRGSSKRQAKAAAARASIHVLIPEMKDELDAHTAAPGGESSEPDFSFFDYVGIEDPRISEFCAATCEPAPHAILRTCLLRNFGAGDRHIHTEMKKLEYQKIEMTMKVGKHSASVVCKNKKAAKQRAAQAILQALHPHVRSWGSLLRLYGSRSVKSCKERKLEEQQITLLQDQARHNRPNRAVLDKLRLDMRRLRERDAAVAPVGSLRLGLGLGPSPDALLPAHSASGLNCVDL